MALLAGGLALAIALQTLGLAGLVLLRGVGPRTGAVALLAVGSFAAAVASAVAITSAEEELSPAATGTVCACGVS